MKTKILFIKHILRDNNLLKEIFLQQFDNKKCTKWITQIKKYMEILQINIHMKETYSVMTIKNMIKNYDNKQWHEDLQNKSTLKLYRKFKFTIQDEQRLYDNTAASTTLFEARSGTLRLNDRNRHTRGDTRCPLCNHEYEDLEHFLLMCDSLKSTRMKIIGLQRPHYEDHEITIAQFLLFNESNEECIMRNRDDLQKLWNHRYAIMNTTIE